MKKVTTRQAIAEVEYELQMRETNYPQWIRTGYLTRDLAVQRFATFRAGLRILQRLERGAEPEPKHKTKLPQILAEFDRELSLRKEILQKKQNHGADHKGITTWIHRIAKLSRAKQILQEYHQKGKVTITTTGTQGSIF